MEAKPIINMLVDVHSCARCGGEHTALQFKTFTYNPIGVEAKVFEFWAMCPETEEPIILRSWYTE
jgi:hypothetical protein